MKGHDDESARRICGEMQQKIEGGKEKTKRAAIEYESYDDCVNQISQQKPRATAIRICKDLQTEGLIREASATLKAPGQAITYQDKNRDKVFLKVFLIDGSVNKNHWGVRPDSISKNIYSAIGKPVVLYKNTGKEPDANQRTVGEYDHPYLGGADSVEHALAYQDLFRVATYIDVFESSTKPGQWWGIAEVTDEGVKRALREDPNIPMYVSPTIRLLSANEPENAHSQWTFMHSAIVDRPAFGIDRAYIGGQCSGGRDTCLLQLRKAAIASNNYEVGCGFCTYKATKEIQGRLRQAASVSSISSFDKFDEKLENRNTLRMSDNNNQNNDPNNNKEQQQQPNNQSDQQNQEQQKQQQEQQQQTVENQTKTTVTKTNNNEQNNSKQASISELLETVQRLAAENKNLQMQLGTAKADVDTHKQINAQYETRLATLEKRDQEREAAVRTEQITNYVNTAPTYRLMAPEERAKQIETFVRGSMSLEEIKNIVEPLNASIAQQFQYPNRYASQRGPSRLSLGANTGRSIEVRSAGATDNKSVEDSEVPFYLQVSDMLSATGGSE